MPQRLACLPFPVMAAVLCIAAITAEANNKELPGGIPDPAWGDLHPLRSSAPAWPNSWPDSEASGYYYVDSGSPAASDRNNAYGYPARPRVTIPETNYAPGSYVEIHGGPYAGGGQIIFTARGTEQAPVWIRGPASDAKAVINGEMIVKGSYVFIENLRFNSNRTLGFRPHQKSMLHHAVVRYCDFDGPGTDVGHRSAIAISGLPGERRYSDIVVHNNRIHDFGDRRSATENDFHGVAVGVYVDRIWIINNEIFNMAGDSVQVGTASASKDRHARQIYIAANDFHDNRENAVDIKSSSDVIVSHNAMYGFEATNTSTGAAVVIHNSPRNVWILGNSISKSIHGVINTGGQNVWVISNLFYDIHHGRNAWQPDRLYSSGSAVHFRGNSSGGIANNTFHDYDIGIQLAKGAGGYSIVNNIFSNRSQADGYDIIATDRDVVKNSTLDRLAFSQPATERLLWRDRIYSVAQLSRGRAGNCEQCISTEQSMFVDAENRDFTPRPGSPVIDAGLQLEELHNFKALYGIDVSMDAGGNPRILGNSIDIGAIEANQ